MKLTVRAAWAVALLAGFYVLAIGLPAALVAVDIVTITYLTAPVALVVFLPMTFAAFLVVLPALFASTGRSRDAAKGVLVTEQDQPALWARVRRLAEVLDTPAPSEIRFDHHANASVRQDSHLLGLMPGARRLTMGAPLLLGLSAAELDAVLAHEFGHYINRDTRLSPVVLRGRVSVLAALSAAAGRPVQQPGAVDGRRELPGRRLIYLLFDAYAVRFLTATTAISRAQEFEADRISAQAAGPRTAIAMLGRTAEVGAAYRYYIDSFVALGADVGLMPEPSQVIASFGDLLATPGLRKASDGRVRPRSDKEARFDSHPALRERIEALKAMPDDGRGAADAGGGRAIDVLDRPSELFAQVGQVLLGDRSKESKGADWDTLVDVAARRHARSEARPLIDALHLMTGVEGTLDAFLDLVDAGRFDEIILRLLTPAQARYAGAGDTAREIGRNTLMASLPPWVLAELGDGDAVRWIHSWSEVAALEIGASLSTELDAAYAALLGDRADAAPLRAVLETARAAAPKRA
ncbi:MAG: M48 family metalloprotease [Actinocrinis sp.]